MPDNFDPDAWPHGASNNPTNGRGPQQPEHGDDDFDPFGFDDEQPSATTNAAASSGRDDRASHEFDFDDAPAPRPAPVATSTRRPDDVDDDDLYSDPFGSGTRGQGGPNGPYSDYDDDYDDDFDSFDDDDDYDNFDFDRDNAGSSGNKKRILGVLAGVFVIGALGLGAISVLGGDDGQTASEAPAPSDVTSEPAEPATPDAEAPAAPGTSQELPADVDAALANALEAWGQFAVSGDLNEVRPYFVNDSQQFLKFETEAATLQANPTEGEPFTMAMTSPEAVETNGDWLVTGIVVASRPGEVEQRFPWEIRISRQSERDQWMISGVRQY